MSVSPIEQEKREDSREVGWGCVRWQVEHKQNDDATGGRHQVVELRKDVNGEKERRCSDDTLLSLLTVRTPSDSSHHVPDVVGQPVDDRVAATDKLQVFSLG